jgi:flagellar basal-body rod modification protein FlgD
MAAAALFNHAMTAGQALMGTAATPADSSTTGTSGTDTSSDASGDSATISANDFLTLLVTEMQNQDPTADTDPNEYIDQLVDVNSLEQLIDINQTLTTGLGVTPANSDDGASGQIAEASSGPAGASGGGALSHTQIAADGPGAVASTTNPISQIAPGNLAVPAVNTAAQQVAHALDGRMRQRAGVIFPPTR